MGEVKQTNFRVNAETADAFRKFCEEQGMNQAQGFDHIMQVVELDHAKSITPGRAIEIEEFERLIKALMVAYLNSLEINNNAELRIREQFASALEGKDKTIIDLQEKVEQLKSEKISAEEIASTASKTADQAVKDAAAAKEQSDTAAQLVAEKDKTIATLAKKLASAENQINRCAELEKSEKESKDRIKELEYTISDLQKDMDRKISDVLKDAELAKEQAVIAKERELRDIYDEKLRAVDKENVKLQIKIEQLQN